MTQHIGIVGCSAEGAALCYKTICVEGAEVLGTHAHPEVSMHTISLAEYLKCTDRGDWQGVAELMLASAQKLAEMGADFLICPANTMHQALPQVLPRSPLPWLHIADAVADEAVKRGFKRLGILGTRWLSASDVYRSTFIARGLEPVHPSATETDELHRIIIEELNCSLFKPEAIAYHQKVIARLRDDGCDAVVLACTEIPLIINGANSALPTLDSTRLLARAALRRAVAGGLTPGAGGQTPQNSIDALFDASYEDLRRLARARLQGGGRNTVLDTTALVHESYLRLAARGTVEFPDRLRFLVYAGKVFRSVIVDLVRQRQTERRGGEVGMVTLTTQLEDVAASGEDQILKVNEALDELRKLDERMAQVVEMRYFAGMTETEIAQALNVTDRTVRRDWQQARLFLAEALS